MSTRTSLIYYNSKTIGDHDVYVHIYHEMHDNLIHCEIECSTCNSHIDFVVPHHLLLPLAKLLVEGGASVERPKEEMKSYGDTPEK